MTNDGVQAFLKALGIVLTMISFRAALKSLRSDTSIFETQTELLHRIDQKLGKLTGETETEDLDLW